MRALFFSIVLTLILALAWKLIGNRNHRSTGLWIAAACYLILTGVYWFDHVSLYWLALVTPLSLFLGILMASSGFRHLLFHSAPEKESKVVVNEVKQGKIKPQSKYTEKDYFAALERKGVSVTSVASLDDMSVGEILKEAEKNGFQIRARNSTK